MKHLLAAATFAALLAAAPAGAQTVYGSVTTGSGGAVSFGATPSGNFKANFLIDASVDLFTTNTGGPLDPLNGDVGATLTANNASGAVFDAGSGNSLTSVSAVPINATSAVPEPATWAMMLIGFGTIGGVLRTRRKAILRFA